MSTEALRGNRFMRELLRRGSADGVATKYNDRVTSGIPDRSYTSNGPTIWLECKYRRHSHTPIAELLKSANRRAKIQIFTIWELYRASKGRAFFLIFEHDGGATLVRVVNPRLETFEVVASGSQESIVNTLLLLCSFSVA